MGEEKQKKSYGGMAVVEGVMMRSPNHYSVACRAPNGKIYVKTEPVEKTWIGRQKWLLKPFLRGTFALLDTMGLGMRAMRIAGDVLSNDFLRQELRDAARKVSEGGSLHRSLDQTGYFPPMLLHMIASGETSGELDSMLERTARMQENTLQSKIAAIVGLFEPMMLLVMGVVVLIIVMAIMLPILNMSNLVG